MRVSLAHLNIQGIDVAVFDAKPVVSTDTARNQLLARLTARARMAGLKVDKSALAYSESGRTMFYGATDLVRFLSLNGVSAWTHWIDV